MKAVVFHGVGDVRVEDVREPRIQDATDAIVRITASAICGTDLHMLRGTLNGMKPGTILGHEGVGVVEEVGKGVRNIRPGDRVVIPSSIACGYCAYCRSSYYSQCDNANPVGLKGGTAFFGGPSSSGSFDGLQAEYARVPFANVGLVQLPGEVTDDQAILLSDVFPTGYFGADIAGITPGDTVAVFGCGPVGQFAIASAKLKGAGRVIAVDCVSSRLEAARAQGAEVIDFNDEDPVQAILGLTGEVGADRAIDAVGVDAYRPAAGPALRKSRDEDAHFQLEVDEILAGHRDEHVHPGNAPNQVLLWAVEALAKAGTLSIIGVYPSSDIFFPLGDAVEKNLTIRMGNCPHRRYIPTLVDLVRTGIIDPARTLTQSEPITSAIAAYQSFEERQPGWLKVKLEPALAK
jgi:threonine dehydrogenase-like Zn-dependent dehydrogenase